MIFSIFFNFRFYPIGEAVQRLTQKDLILKDYLIPAGVSKLNFQLPPERDDYRQL